MIDPTAISATAACIKEKGVGADTFYNLAEMERTIRHNESRIIELMARVTQLERLVQYPNGQLTTSTHLKAQAAQVEATKDLYAPLRSNVDPLIRLSNFARRLLDPHDLGHAVSFEVRELAREALGKEKQG